MGKCFLFYCKFDYSNFRLSQISKISERKFDAFGGFEGKAANLKKQVPGQVSHEVLLIVVLPKGSSLDTYKYNGSMQS